MRIFILLVFTFFINAFQSNIHKTSKTSILTYNSNAQTTNIIFQSDDDGQTWKDLSAGLPEKVTVDRVFVQGEDIYLAAGNGVIYHNNHTQTGIWESENVGGIFMNAAAIFPKEKIIGLFPGHYGPYASVYKNGFSRKIAGTSHWQQMGYTLEDKTINCVLEKSDGTIFITCESGIYKSDNDGKSWKQIFSDGWVSSLVLANGVFVGNGAHGLIRSTDDGEQWEYVLKDDGGFYQTSVIDGGFAAVRLAGIWRTSADNFPQRTFTSKDSGKTWKRLDKATIPIQAIRQLEQAEHFLFCSQKAGIFRSSDEGKSWNLIKSSKGIANPMRLELSVSGNKIFAVKVFDGC